jgi:hypothetical protein
MNPAPTVSTGAPPWDVADQTTQFWVSFKVAEDWLFYPWGLIRKAKLRPEFHRLRLYIPTEKVVIEILGPRVEELAGELSRHAATRITVDGPDGLRSIGLLPLEIVEAQDDAVAIATAVRGRPPENEPREGVMDVTGGPDSEDEVNLGPL